MSVPRVVFLCSLGLCFARGAEPWINELHYDNAGADEGEGVEIAGPAGLDLADYEIILYNGNDGLPYDSLVLSGIIPDEGAGFGARFFPAPGMQNGPSEGLALFRESNATLVEFVSYEGGLVATGDAADGEASQALPIRETGSVAAGQTSLQRTGQGAQGSDFAWVGPVVPSPGLLNQGQTIHVVSRPILEREETHVAQGQAWKTRIKFVPPHSSTVTLRLESSPPGLVQHPANVSIPAGEEVEVECLVPSQAGLGSLPVELRLREGEGPILARQSWWVLEANGQESRQGWWRVASWNLRFGVGGRGTKSFRTMQRVMARIDADTWAFQEVSSRGDFAILRALAEELGFPVDARHFAGLGEAFAGQPAVNGAAPSDQFLVVLSRHSLSQVEQVERGLPGREEMTRYPLLAKVSVPGWPQPVSLLNLHLKAGGSDADEFRRATEAERIRRRLALLAPGPLIILGDCNEDTGLRPQPLSCDTELASRRRFPDGSFLPFTFRLGADLRALDSLPYAVFPDQAFARFAPHLAEAKHADALLTRTLADFGESHLDYLFLSDDLAARAEVYDPLIDGRFQGLPKPGAPLPAELDAGSDHYPVWADIAPRARPGLRLEVSTKEVFEGGAIEGTLRAEGLALPREIELRSSRPDIAPGARLLLSAEAPVASFRLPVAEDSAAQADVDLLLSADSELAQVLIRNRQASSEALITEYLRDETGAWRALELTNRGLGELDLAKTPLVIFESGPPRSLELSMRLGKWRPQQTVVIGDESARQTLISNGLLTPEIEGIDGGRAFLDGGGRLIFIRRDFRSRGRLEVQVAYRRADLTPSSPARHEVRTPFALLGNDGSDGSLTRFVSVQEPSAGLGLPPEFSVAFAAWRSSAQLMGDDEDGDGWSDFAEFAFGGNPRQFTSGDDFIELIAEGTNLAVRHRRRVDEPALRYQLEETDDLRTWLPSDLVPERAATADPDYATLRYPLPSALARRFYRVRAME